MAAIRRKKIEYKGYHEVSKVTILKRLQAAGIYDTARGALDEQDQFTQELWTAAQVIRSNDEIVRGLLSAIGADVDAILAKE